MQLFTTVDWGFLEAFFGEYGELITTVVGFAAALIGLLIAYVKYLKAKVVREERDQARADLDQARADAREAKAQAQQDHQRVIEQRQALEAREAEIARKDVELHQLKERLIDRETGLNTRENQLNEVRSAFVGKEHDLWCIHKARPPADYSARIWAQRQKPIITIANLKGGVGKTTLTANLAAYFSHIGKRVLLIDVDYQGSLTNMLLSADKFLDSVPQVNKLLAAGASAADFAGAVHAFQHAIPLASMVPAKYQLAPLENQVMIGYLLQEDAYEDDGRFRLAKILLDPQVSEMFDIVLIDAPPRLTAGTINAFCASTHLLIPTLFDQLSAETVGTFLKGVVRLKTNLNPCIDLLGIVGMLTQQQTALVGRERNARNVAESEVMQTWGPHYFFERHIPRKAAIAEAAGDSIAYFEDAVVRGWFDELGAEMVARLNLQTHQPDEAAARTPRLVRRAESAVPHEQQRVSL